MSKLFDLTGRLALITGSSRGIGRAIAEGYIEAGARVVINGRDAKAVDATVKALGAKAVAAPFDVTDRATVESAIGKIEADENLRVLTRLVDHFEQHVEVPLALDQEFGSRLARGTVGVRLPISRFVCKVKMSQDKDPQSQRHVLEALRRRGPYFNPALADEMERALSAT